MNLTGLDWLLMGIYPADLALAFDRLDQAKNRLVLSRLRRASGSRKWRRGGSAEPGLVRGTKSLDWPEPL